MRLPRTAAALLALALCTTTRARAQQDFSKVEIKVTKVAGNVYLLEGMGGNIAAIIDPEGIAIVDDQYAPLAPKIKAALATLSPKPVKFIINTHWHGDHTGGNATFAETASILAHANVRKRLVSGGDGLRGKIPPAEKAALPLVTFEEGLTLYWGDDEVKVLHLKPAHTDGDSAVFFTKANVVHLGDTFFSGKFPFVDYASGGTLKGELEMLEELLPKLPKDVKIIPGHGPVSSVDDVKEYLSMLRETIALVHAGKRAGKTAEQMKAGKIFAKWEAWGKGFINPDFYLDEVLAEMK
jgi:glyoxylase-like metal-dependent hydrolase (beta-lactamase superfamily II)